jgi:hypothetical protein
MLKVLIAPVERLLYFQFANGNSPGNFCAVDEILRAGSNTRYSNNQDKKNALFIIN